MEVTGTIKQIGELQSFDSGFTKVEFVVTIDEDTDYPQDIKFEAIKDKADNVIKFNKVGDKVDVSFNLRGNEYNGKYYVNLQAWKVFKSDGQPSAPKVAEPVEELDDQLPF